MTTDLDQSALGREDLQVTDWIIGGADVTYRDILVHARSTGSTEPVEVAVRLAKRFGRPAHNAIAAHAAGAHSRYRGSQ